MPLGFRHQTYHANKLRSLTTYSDNRVMLSSAVLSQYTRDTDYDRRTAAGRYTNYTAVLSALQRVRLKVSYRSTAWNNTYDL